MTTLAEIFWDQIEKITYYPVDMLHLLSHDPHEIYQTTTL